MIVKDALFHHDGYLLTDHREGQFGQVTNLPMPIMGRCFFWNYSGEARIQAASSLVALMRAAMKELANSVDTN